TTLTDVVSLNNTDRGVLVNEAETLDVTGGQLSRNGLHGLVIPGGTGTAPLTGVVAVGNTGSFPAGADAPHVAALIVSGGDFSGNSDDGIELVSGVTTARLSGASLTGNGDLGLAVGQLGGGQEVLTLSDLTITGNGDGGNVASVTTLNFTGTT